jgi:hypothetical protein
MYSCFGSQNLGMLYQGDAIVRSMNVFFLGSSILCLHWIIEESLTIWDRWWMERTVIRDMAIRAIPNKRYADLSDVSNLPTTWYRYQSIIIIYAYAILILIGLCTSRWFLLAMFGLMRFSAIHMSWLSGADHPPVEKSHPPRQMSMFHCYKRTPTQ